MTSKDMVHIISQRTSQLMTTIGTLVVSAGFTSYAINGKMLPEGAVQFINHSIFPIVILIVYINIILVAIFFAKDC